MLLTLFSSKLKKNLFLIPLNGDYTTTGIKPTHEHYHSPYHIIITVEGSGVLQRENSSTKLTERSIVLIDPMEKHLFSSSDEKGTITYFSFNFYLLDLPKTLNHETERNIRNISFLETYSIKNKLADVFDLTITDDGHILYSPLQWNNIKLWMHHLEGIFLNYNSEILTSQYAELQISRSFINASVYSFITFSEYLWKNRQQALSQKEQNIVMEVNQYMEKNISSPFSLEELSKHVSYSSVYLCRVFKKATGYTLNQYFNKMKINKARQYLSTTNYNLSMISDLVGFSSASHFCKNFKKETGVSPSEYTKCM